MSLPAHLIYFSPTGTTRTIVKQIASGLNTSDAIDHDLTLHQSNEPLHVTNGIAIFGIPVYAGRVPEDCLKRFANITGDGTPAILVALYGNRAYEDALVELQDLVEEQGFKVTAAGAFIGEHSYATSDYPVALNRPNNEDCNIAVQFGRQIAEKLQSASDTKPAISGNHPYRDRVTFGGVAPETTNATCTLCNKCAEVCPVNVISVSDSVQTNAADCIICCACVKSCPTGARIFTDEYVQVRREMLLKNCSEPKQPELFI